MSRRLVRCVPRQAPENCTPSRQFACPIASPEASRGSGAAARWTLLQTHASPPWYAHRAGEQRVREMIKVVRRLRTMGAEPAYTRHAT